MVFAQISTLFKKILSSTFEMEVFSSGFLHTSYSWMPAIWRQVSTSVWVWIRIPHFLHNLSELSGNYSFWSKFRFILNWFLFRSTFYEMTPKFFSLESQRIQMISIPGNGIKKFSNTELFFNNNPYDIWQEFQNRHSL